MDCSTKVGTTDCNGPPLPRPSSQEAALTLPAAEHFMGGDERQDETKSRMTSKSGCSTRVLQIPFAPRVNSHDHLRIPLNSNCHAHNIAINTHFQLPAPTFRLGSSTNCDSIMSRPAKLTLLGTSLFAGLTVVFVHWQQKYEKQVCHFAFPPNPAFCKTTQFPGMITLTIWNVPRPCIKG